MSGSSTQNPRPPRRFATALTIALVAGLATYVGHVTYIPAKRFLGSFDYARPRLECVERMCVGDDFFAFGTIPYDEIGGLELISCGPNDYRWIETLAVEGFCGRSFTAVFINQTTRTNVVVKDGKIEVINTGSSHIFDP